MKYFDYNGSVRHGCPKSLFSGFQTEWRQRLLKVHESCASFYRENQHDDEDIYTYIALNHTSTSECILHVLRTVVCSSWDKAVVIVDHCLKLTCFFLVDPTQIDILLGRERKNQIPYIILNESNGSKNKDLPSSIKSLRGAEVL